MKEVQFLLQNKTSVANFEIPSTIDFLIAIYPDFGSILLANGIANESYVSEIQHVRRRETIAMTPANCLIVLQTLVGDTVEHTISDQEA